MARSEPIPRDLAHELRTPLAAVITSLDLIAGGELHLDPAEVTEIVQAAKSDAEHLLTVIEAARGGGQSRQTSAVVVSEVVRRVLERFPQVKVRTHLRVDPTATAVIDAAGFDQILTNLLQNVDRYAPEGQVEIRGREEGDRVLVEVSDDGPGIADPRSIFLERPEGSDQGMHLGLAVSRRLAREADGDLVVADPLRSGATFRLTLPAGERFAGVGGPLALAPRARVLVELAGALEKRSLSQAEAGLSRIAHDLLATTAVAVLVGRRDGFERVGAGGRRRALIPATDPAISQVRRDGEVLTTAAEAGWIEELVDAQAAILVWLQAGVETNAILALGIPVDVEISPDDEVVRALATVAELAVARTALGEEVETERTLRSSVLEALPIAVSIFAGDPPRLVDQNRAERRMLGLAEGEQRPKELEATQLAYDVRFADGTLLTLENAPVTRAIRTGEHQGPFFLRLRRADGSELFSRTYCAPFFDTEGRVAGAVVTSEEVESLD